MKNGIQTTLIIVATVAITLMINNFSLPQPHLNGIETQGGHDALDRIVKSGTLRCAYIPYPPYFDIDPNTGEKHGIMVDIMEAVSGKMNVELEWAEEVGWGSMMEGLKTNRYDAVCSSVWQNTARALQADFSRAIGYSTVEAWVRSDESIITSLNDIDEQTTIATIDGEMNAMIAATQFPNVETFSIPQTAQFSDAFLNVVNGKADIIFAERSAVDLFLKENPNALKSLGDNNIVSSFPIAVVLPKGEETFKTVIDTAIEEIIHTRKLDMIMADYETESGDVFARPANPF